VSLAIHYPDSRLQVNLAIYGGQFSGNSKPIIGTGTSKLERDLRFALKFETRSAQTCFSQTPEPEIVPQLESALA